MSSITRIGTRLTEGLDATALRAIDAYRTRLSPRKGWRCAAGAAGGATCSTAIRQSVATAGVVASVLPAVRQFATCAASARALGGTRLEGVCCCGPIPIPFRF